MSINQRNGLHVGAHYQAKKFGKIEHKNSIKEQNLYHYLVRIKKDDGSLEDNYLAWDDFIFRMKGGGTLNIQIVESPEFGNNNITKAQKLKGSSSYTKDKKENYEFFTTDRPLLYHIQEEVDSVRLVRFITLEQLDLTAVGEDGLPANQLDLADIFFTDTLTDIPDITSDSSGEYLSLHRMKKYSFGDNPTEIIITGNSQQPQNVKYIAIKTHGAVPVESKKLFIDDEDGNQVKSKVWYGKKITKNNNGKYEIVAGGTEHFPMLAWPKEQDNLRANWQLPWISELRYAEDLFKSIEDKKFETGYGSSSNVFYTMEQDKDYTKLGSNSTTFSAIWLTGDNFETMEDYGNDSSENLYSAWNGATTVVLGNGRKYEEDGTWSQNIGWLLTGANEYSNPPSNHYGQKTDRGQYNQNGYSILYAGRVPTTNLFNIDAQGIITTDDFDNRDHLSEIGLYKVDNFATYYSYDIVIGGDDSRNLVFTKPVLNEEVWNYKPIPQNGEWPDGSDSSNTVGLLVEDIINGDITLIGGKSYDTNILNDDALTVKLLDDVDYNETNQWHNFNDGKNMVLFPENPIEIFNRFKDNGGYLKRGLTQNTSGYSTVLSERVLEVIVNRQKTGTIKPPLPTSLINNFLTHEALVEKESYGETWIVLELKKDGDVRLRAQDIVRHLHTRTTMWYLDSNFELSVDQTGKPIEPIERDTLSKRTKNYFVVNERTTWLGI